MRLNRLRYPILAAAALLAIPGCANDAVAPEAALPVEGAAVFKVIPTYAPDMRSADIIVEPSGGVFVLGKHAIHFPPNSICDPAVSTYGPTEWDKPCTAIREPIRIHAELREVADRSWVDFTPALRFVPSGRDERWVYLFMKTDATTKGKGGDAPPILWSPAIGIPGIDESLTDRTMRTKWDKKLGGVYRRIKHFSGYNVHSGYARESTYER